MKLKHNLFILFLAFAISACQTNESLTKEEDTKDHSADEVVLNIKNVKKLGIQLDTLGTYTFQGVVHTNGKLEVPPQFEASITAILGGNVAEINIMEGEVVKKGQILAYLQHPDYIVLQTDYMKAYHQNEFLKIEYDRQKKLGDAEIGAKKDFQRIQSELAINVAELKGYEAQIQLLQLDLNQIQNGNLYKRIPVISPISGSIEEIHVQIGQYVDAQTKMFGIVNTEHVHADFMVFENDVMNVREGQKVRFTIGNSPKTYNATIISVGKQFEENPKALHIHADIDKEDEKGINFINGMYIKGEIFTTSDAQLAVPESAIINEDGKDYIFYVKDKPKDELEVYTFEMLEILELHRENNWIAIELIGKLPKNALIVQDGAYYLISEMKKDELDHDH